MERERAVKAETIKPAPARVAQRSAVFALIQERACLLPFKQVDPEFDPVLDNEKIITRCMAG